MNKSTETKNSSDPTLFDANEAARRLNISQKSIRKHTDSGLLPCYRVSRLIRFNQACLDAFLTATYDPGEVG